MMQARYQVCQQDLYEDYQQALLVRKSSYAQIVMAGVRADT